MKILNLEKENLPDETPLVLAVILYFKTLPLRFEIKLCSSQTYIGLPQGLNSHFSLLPPPQAFRIVSSRKSDWEAGSERKLVASDERVQGAMGREKRAKAFPLLPMIPCAPTQ